MDNSAKGKTPNAARHARRERSSQAKIKIIDVRKALASLQEINREIHYASCFDEKQFTSGLITFRPTKGSDSKQIRHDDKDVVCHVLQGQGRLRVNGRRIQLRPGKICHIPKRTPHDFAAGKKTDLVLFYSLIKTG
jgi:mannose-6-phosphate isomerase-like protein (cupin superfamily)